MARAARWWTCCWPGSFETASTTGPAKLSLRQPWAPHRRPLALLLGQRSTMQIGMLYAAGAYILWGLFPIYFKALQDFSPLEILLQRVVWALAFVLIVLALRRTLPIQDHCRRIGISISGRSTTAMWSIPVSAI